MLDRSDLEPAFFAPFVSSLMRVEPQWIDYNGHLNMAYYNVLFDRAVDEVYELLGIGAEYLKNHRHSTFTAEVHVRYVRELQEGDPVRVTFQLLDLIQTLPLFRAVVSCDRRMGLGDIRKYDAACRHDSQKVAPFPPPILRTFARMKAAHSQLPRPEAAGRRISMPQKG